MDVFGLLSGLRGERRTVASGWFGRRTATRTATGRRRCAPEVAARTLIETEQSNSAESEAWWRPQRGASRRWPTGA